MYADYDEQDLLNRDPIELVRLLYGKALGKLGQARSLMADDDVRARNTAIARASEIVIELQGSLDAKRGGELALSLERLYEYIQQRLAEGLAQRTNAPLEEATALLSSLAEGWREADAGRSACGDPSPGALEEPVLSGAGHSWTV